jgi:hypothetical protein
MDYKLPFTFNSVSDERIGRRQLPGFRLVDSEGGVWEFAPEDPSATKKFLVFLKVPKKYKPMLGIGLYVNLFKAVEKAALKAIESYEITKSLTPKTAQTFKELIDEL